MHSHRTETFKLSTDPLFIDKIRDVVGLYRTSPTRPLVLCVNEKAQSRALDCTQPLLSMRPGQVERHAHDCRWHGTTSLFAALDVKSGRVIDQCHQRRRAHEFRQLFDTIEANVLAKLDVYLIVDNYSAHKTALIRRWLLKRHRFYVHFTPTGGSWLNLVERWFTLLTEKQLCRGAYQSVRHPQGCDSAYLAYTNENSKLLVWTKTAKEFLANVVRFRQRISETER